MMMIIIIVMIRTVWQRCLPGHSASQQAGERARGKCMNEWMNEWPWAGHDAHADYYHDDNKAGPNHRATRL